MTVTGSPMLADPPPANIQYFNRKYEEFRFVLKVDQPLFYYFRNCISERENRSSRWPLLPRWRPHEVDECLRMQKLAHEQQRYDRHPTGRHLVGSFSREIESFLLRYCT